MFVRIIIISAFLLHSIHVFSQSWSKIITTGNVPKLKNHSAIYHPATNSMVVFGGRTPTANSNEIWSLNLATNQWTQLIPSGNLPSPRFTQNANYDSLNNRMIIWSGQGTELYNDVWAYSFASNTWLQLWPDGNVSGVPLKRYGTASVFDPANRRFVTFAGFTTSGRFEDTWTFNVDNMTWTDRTNNPHPPKRCLHSACFAYDLRKMVIYAGQDTGPLDDIWSLDIDNFSWQNITPALKPPGRFWNSIIYYGSGNLVIFGGLGSQPLNDMWKFSISGNQWESVNQGSNIPPARWGHTAVYVPEQDRMLIFGGEGDSTYNDTWQFTNVSVIAIEPVSQFIPKNFSLEQNYPNPFNPVTKIKFDLPNVGTTRRVTLTVFDIIGTEIRTLINGSLLPGSYEINFDGSNLPSGVYFYRLTAGKYIASRKMILLK
ncbi:MAG: T9SS type A sorting domain-containing protein [Chlorobi bacterium]|nr:T9SS type A sorting domain-containing protein [Chlorobiota bacterium]MCI0714985.1 T9SS type A sorting domain-containing protein [Chlorobiota bacterium]